MKGIKALHPYIPKYRVPVSKINHAWGVKGGKGKRAVANFDEDVITMAVQTVIGKNISETIESCVLATTSSPFKEESAAAIVAYTLGLEENCHALDVNQSIVGGLASLTLGKDSLVIASDRRSVEIGSALEKEIGDAACAIEIGTDNVIAEIVAHERRYDFGYQTWQRSNDATIFLADDKFSTGIRTKQYVDTANKLLIKSGLSTNDVHHLIVADRSERMSAKVAGLLGNKELASKSILYQEVGYSGVSMPFLMLGEVLQEAKPGELILCMQSGSGVEAILFRVTEEIVSYQKENSFQKQFMASFEIEDYHHFLQKRTIVERSDLKPYSTLAYLRRERETNLRLAAQECESCGAIHFPKQVLCRTCKQKLPEQNKYLSRNGKVFTYTEDYVFPGNETHVTMVVVDLEGGGRIFTQLTEAETIDMKVGLDVKLVFRKVHEGADYPNYFWKAVPNV